MAQPLGPFLGPLEVWCDGRRVPVSAAKQRTLLAILLLRAGRVVAAEELIDQQWGERPPTSARKTLHNYVRRLRTTLAAGADARGRAHQTLVDQHKRRHQCLLTGSLSHRADE
jgi:DNA-binding SARP family transcriptional activator